MNKLQDLLGFAKDNGVVMPEGIKFESVEGKGLCCVAKILVRNAKFELPRKLIITRELSSKHFGEKVVEQHQNAWLKLFFSKLKYSDEPVLLEGVNVSELFTPYINALPSVIDSPLVWNPAELSLLNGTNLFLSLKAKLQLIYKEWLIVIEQGEFNAQRFDLDQLSTEDIYRDITSKVFDSAKKEFFSFPAFLWSHLMFTSRAFPERVINPDCDPSGIILLPVLDLLNHENRSKIQWSCSDEGSFVFEKLEDCQPGAEICNNYGAKGNEELLYGYGFAIDGNEFDNLALKMKLPLSVIESILQDKSIHLPTFEDYTTFAFDSSKPSSERRPEGSVHDYKDGVLYFINSRPESLIPLLDLFGHLHKNENENPKSLRCQLTSLQALKGSLRHKLGLITGAEPLQPAHHYHQAPCRAQIADIYRSGQIKILRDAVDNVRALQKHILTTYKKNLASIKNVVKTDKAFQQDFARLLADASDTEPRPLLDEFECALAWLLVRSAIPPPEKTAAKYQWVLQQFQAYAARTRGPETTAAGRGLFSHFFPNGTDRFTPSFMETLANFLNNETFLNETSDSIQVPIFAQPVELHYT